MNGPTIHSTSACIPLVLALAGAACGDEGGGLDPGQAAITGTLAEQAIAPAAAFYGLHPFGGYDVLVMPEDASVACDFAEGGQGLTAVIGFPCGAATSDEYAIAATDAPCDPGAPHVWLLVEGFDGEFDEYIADSGSVTIAASEGGVAGSFAAGFGDKGDLDGEFNAERCPD
jgi:hypothetical protein